MGIVFKIPGYLLFVIGGLWGFVLCMRFIYDALGFLGAFLALALAPAVIGIVPLYAGFAKGNWDPMLFTYGVGITAVILIGIGSLIDKD